MPQINRQGFDKDNSGPRKTKNEKQLLLSPEVLIAEIIKMEKGKENTQNSKTQKTSKRLKLLFLNGCLFLLSLLIAADLYVGTCSKGRLYCRANEVPQRSAALVLGCGKCTQGRLNLYYQYRIAATVELWEAGKIDAILVSGDNSRKDYDEPSAMKTDLVARGIPAEYITVDLRGVSDTGFCGSSEGRFPVERLYRSFTTVSLSEGGVFGEQQRSFIDWVLCG